MISAVQALRAPVTGILDRLLRGDSDTAKAQRGAAFAFAIRVASAAIAYFSQVLLARWMGAFEFGVFAYVWVFVLILGGLSTIGLNTSVLRFLPEYKEKGEWALFRGFLDGSRFVSFAVATVIMLCGMAITWSLHGVIEDYYLIPLVIAFACLPGYAITDIQDGISRSQSWIDLALIPPYIMRPLLLLVFLGAAIMAGLPANALTALSAALAAIYLTTVVQVAIMGRRFGKIVPKGERAYRMPLWLKVSAPILLMHSFYMLMQNVDVLALNIYVPPSELAIYYAAIKTTSLIAFVHFAVTAAYSARFSEYHSAGRHGELAEHVRDSVKWAFWPSLLAAAGILSIGIPLLWLFGPQFTAGYPVMFILAAGLIARAAIGPGEALLSILGQQNICAAVMFITLLVNIALNFVLIPRFGLEGAAMATAGSIMLESVFLFAIIKSRLGLHAFIIGGGKRADFAE